MDKLDRDWLTKDNTDFEYKKYILLDYLQRVTNQFKENKLYPYLSDCIEEFRSLKDLIEQKDKLTPKELTSIDLKKMELIYTTIEDDIFVETQKLINYALRRLKGTIEEGRKICDIIEENIDFKSVGVITQKKEEGYLILTTTSSIIYKYKMDSLILEGNKYKMLKTQPITTQNIPQFSSHEDIKQEYINNRDDIPMMTYGAYSKEEIPFENTFLPIVKRILIREINKD
jgi:hypothetical protein